MIHRSFGVRAISSQENFDQIIRTVFQGFTSSAFLCKMFTGANKLDQFRELLINFGEHRSSFRKSEKNPCFSLQIH